MKRQRIINTLLLLLATLTAMAQHSVWWIDNDYDGRTAVTASEQIELEIDISKMTPGVHIFNFRTSNSDGTEGALHRHGFVVAPEAAMYDYWIDNRTEQIMTAKADSFEVDLNGLSAGVHYLNVRPRHLDGTMGAVSRRAFQVAPSIAAYQYMFTADSLLQTVNVSPTNELTMQEQEFDIPVSDRFYDINAETAFRFDSETISLIRTDTTQFSMRFLTDEWQQSAPWEVEACIADTITQQLIALRADTMCIAEKGDRGDFRAFRLVAEQEGTYQFSVTQDCDLRLYQQTDSLPFDVRHMTADEVLTLRGEGGQSLYALIYNIARDTLANSSDNIGIRYSAPTAEAYAVLEEDKTLKFYYDTKKEERNGMSVGESYARPENVLWYDQRHNISSVVFDHSFANCTTLTSTPFWFYDFSQLTTITGIANLKTDNVTNMYGMFAYCEKLTTLDLSGFNTAKVENMDWLFYRCSELETVYVGDLWSTASVTMGQEMFYACHKLVGGKGSSCGYIGHYDHTYAHIDGGASNPGYFTLNPERVKNGNIEGEDYSSFALSYNLQVQELTQENIVEDSEHPGNQCIKVVSLENPEEVTHSQFMIRIGEPMKTGQKYRFSMDYKASKGALVTSQVHTEPGEYLNWYGFGNFTATPEWQTYEVEGEVSTENNGFKTIVFNLSEEKSSTEFFFDNISFKVDAVEEEVPDTVETPTFEFANSWDSDLSIKTETEGAEIYYTMNGRMLKEDDANFSYGTLGRYSDWKAWGDNLQEAKSVYNEDVYAGSYSSNYMLKLTSRVDSVMESAQLGYRFNKALTKNDYYTIHFQARSASGNGQIQFFCQNDTLADTRSVADTMAIGKEWADYEYTVRIANDNTNQIVLNFGGVADTYYIDNVLFGPIISDTINGNLRTRYERPIEIRDDVTITAIAVKEGMIESKPAVYDYFYEGWMMLLYTYEKGRVILDECDGDPNVPLSDVYEMKARMDDMLYSYYERRTEERFDDYELKYAAEEMMARLDMVYQMKQGFVINGIAYHAVDSTQVEVRKPLGYGSVYKGAVTIAPEVFYNNINFRVTSVTEDAFANSELGAIVWNADFTVPDEVSTMVNNPNLLVYVKSDALAPRNITNVVINGVAKDIVLVDATTDNGNFLVPETFTAEQISYQRVFNQKTMVGVCRGWESIALPFNVQTITHEKQGAISPFGRGDSNKHFWLRRLGANGIVQADKIEAYVPYIIAMPNSSEYSEQFNLPGRVTFSATNAIVPVTEERTLALSDSTIMMTSTMQRLGRSSRYYAINVGEVRGQYLEGSVFERDYREIRPFEAYTTHAANVPAPRFVPINDINGGNMTGIDALLVNSEEVNSEKWYDLNGRRLQKKPTQKGVYLLNGRKVVMR